MPADARTMTVAVIFFMFGMMVSNRMTSVPKMQTPSLDSDSTYAPSTEKGRPKVIPIPTPSTPLPAVVVPSPQFEQSDEDVFQYMSDHQEVTTRYVKGVLYTVHKKRVCKNQAQVQMREWAQIPVVDLSLALSRCVDSPLCHSVSCWGTNCAQNVAACILVDSDDKDAFVFVNIARTPKKLHLHKTLMANLKPLSELKLGRAIASSSYTIRNMGETGENKDRMDQWDQPMRREWSHESNPPYIEVTMDDFKRMCDTAGYVDPRHKLVFFVIPKVASTGLRRLYDRLVGHEDITLDANSTILMHRRDNDPTRERVAFRNFNLTVMNQVMNDPSYRKVLFLRDPATRLLSGFLHLFMRKSTISRKGDPNFSRMFGKQQITWDEFTEAVSNGPHGKPPRGNGENVNAHYRQQSITGHIFKFIPVMDYVGWANSDHIRKMLEKYGLWEQYGATGWGSRGGFMQEASYHQTGAADHKSEYMTDKHIKRTKKGYRMDYAMLESVGLTSEDSPPSNGYFSNPYTSVCQTESARPRCLPGRFDPEVVENIKKSNQ